MKLSNVNVSTVKAGCITCPRSLSTMSAACHTPSIVHLCNNCNSDRYNRNSSTKPAETRQCHTFGMRFLFDMLRQHTASQVDSHSVESASSHTCPNRGDARFERALSLYNKLCVIIHELLLYKWQVKSDKPPKAKPGKARRDERRGEGGGQ